MDVAVVSLASVHHRDTEATRRLHDLALRLNERGHDVTVCCAAWWGGDIDHWVDESTGMHYHAIAETPDAGRGLVWSVPKALRAVDPDVVHANLTPPLAAAAASLKRAPLVAEWYGETALPGGWWQRRAFDRADAMVTPSRMVKTDLREAGADGDRIEVVPTSISMDRVRSTPPAEDAENHIVYARHLDADANVESLLLGLAELRDFDWSATIVGDGPKRADYEAEARDLRIRDRLTFAGECSREERIALYRNAHVFVQTARKCAFATELLWALACGCVGIVEYHAESSAHELVEGRERGFRTTSEQEMADAIRSAGDLESKTVDEDFAAFDEEAVLGRYLDRYRSLQDEYGLL